MLLTAGKNIILTSAAGAFFTCYTGFNPNMLYSFFK